MILAVNLIGGRRRRFFFRHRMKSLLHCSGCARQCRIISSSKNFPTRGQPRLGGQKFFGHWPAQFQPEMPAALINESSGNQLRLLSDGQPHRAGVHLKIPAVAKWHTDFFIVRFADIRRDAQRVARAENASTSRSWSGQNVVGMAGSEKICPGAA